MTPGPNTTHFARLLDRIRAGDPSAGDQLVNDAYRRVHDLTHFVLRGEYPQAGRGLGTDEIVSLSMEQFFHTVRNGLSRVPANPAELFGFVGRIVRCTVIDEVRRRAGRKFRTQFPPAGLPADHDTPGGKDLSDEVLERLAWQEMVERLPEDEAALLTWRYVWQLTNEEIAGESGCDPSTVSKRLRAVLLKLRGLMAPPGSDETA
jgi:RNA polymerase sigma factor (sigma-70 family)